MALPKKKKTDININPPIVGFEELEYGKERIEELLANTNENSVNLPRTIGFEDIDWEINEFVENNNLELVIDGEKVPVFYLDNDRWGEFSKTWKLMDEDKNVPTPYITIRRSDKKKGTRLEGKNRVAQNKKFRYVDIPVQDEGEIIYIRYKTPEPTNVDLEYDVRFFTKYRENVNQYDEQVFRIFASIQDYIFVYGNPMPIYLEDISENNTVDNIDGDRYFVSSYKILCKGFIINEKEFEITKLSRPPRIGFDLSK